MGIAGLLGSTLNFIGGMTEFGLSTSAVKDVAEASGSENLARVSEVAIVLRRLVWLTGILGTILTIVLSPWLSEVAFGNRNYTSAFVLISVALLLRQVSNGQLVMLRGMRRLKHLASVDLLSSVSGLFLVVPLYYFWGLRGIVPGIIVLSVVTLILSWHFSRKIKIERVRVSILRTFARGRQMIVLGFMISLSGLLALGSGYLVRIYVNRIGGIEQVGLYVAGFAIINTYVGLIFTAMSVDYFPRLSAAARNNEEAKRLINQQAEVALLILAPILTVFLVFMNEIIVLLYSNKFAGIHDFILWAALGMFFKAVSWAVAFILLAKGESKVFFWNELFASVYALGLNLLGYRLFGLTGLGISFMAGYMVYLLQVFIICKRKYDFSFTAMFYQVYAVQFVLALVCFLIVMYTGTPQSYMFGSVIILLSCFYSYKELDKRLDLRSMLLGFMNRA